VQKLRRLRELNAARGSDLLNPDLLFGTAWFWTLPEVHEVQKEIDALNARFRRSIGISHGRETRGQPKSVGPE